MAERGFDRLGLCLRQLCVGLFPCLIMFFSFPSVSFNN